tara:strand:+ start:376 stop:612 length:237 start_codon:yes stop_codon:yes gene_type:complete
MSDWITVKDTKEKEIQKEVKNEWIKKKVKKELAEEKKNWISLSDEGKEKKQDKARVENKASGGLIRGFPKLATKGFKR